MKPILSICIFLSSLLMLANCGCSSAKQSAQSTKSVTTRIEDLGLDLSKYKTLPIKANKTYTLKSNWDLKGETYVMPEGVTLKSRGGVFKNGTLIGNNTKINTKKPLFNKVSIGGYWNVPEISTGMFVSLDYENSLRDVLALTHPEVMNTVVIEDGDYWVSAKSFQPALEVCSNTTLVIDGTIRLLPNNFKGCFVVQVKGAENVAIKGAGSIVGDKKEHNGTDGEWGHGINIIKSNNVVVDAFSVTECWGDCIYVGGWSNNISILSCSLSYGRRQGVSITCASNVVVRNCRIDNIKGTNPQYGIDVEPNEDEIVDNVLIENNRIENCYGGVLAYGLHKNCKIGSLKIANCIINGTTAKYPVCLTKCEDILIIDCIVNSDDRTSILVEDNNNVTTRNNSFNSTNKIPYKVISCKKVVATEKHTILK